MNATTATVEVLTAEVRVLMVGSRQVTLSVAKQLDVVGYRELEPFGRIRLSDQTLLIGRAIEGGSLARAELPRYANIPELVYGDFPRDQPPPMLCDHWRGPTRVTWKGRDVVLHEREGCGITAHWAGGGSHCDPAWDCRGHGAALDRVIHDHDTAVTARREALELPLIVLAGLR